MAIAQTGSTTFTDDPALDGASGTLASITVPADAQIMLIGVSGYSSVANRLATTNNFNIGAATSIGASGGTGTGATSTLVWQCALHYILAPPTGTQNLGWHWGGPGAGNPPFALSDSGVIVGYCFLKGIDTASPIRSQDGSNGTGTSESTGTLTAQSGDWIVAFAGTFNGANTNLTFTWSGGGSATEIGATVNSSHVDASFGKAEPTGNQAITWTAAAAEEGGISAFVIKAAATGGPDLTVSLAEPTISITTF